MRTSRVGRKLYGLLFLNIVKNREKIERGKRGEETINYLNRNKTMQKRRINNELYNCIYEYCELEVTKNIAKKKKNESVYQQQNTILCTEQ